MMLASHVAESLRDSEEPPHRCGVSLGEADLRGGVQRVVSEKRCVFDVEAAAINAGPVRGGLLFIL